MNNRHYLCFFVSLLFFASCFGIASEARAPRTLLPPDRLQYPALEFRLPAAERIELQNGMVLFFLANRELPLVSLSVLVRTGSAYDPPGKEGVAELTAYLLRTGGTKKTESAGMDERFDFLGVSPSVSMGLDSASVHFTFPKSDLDSCLDLLSQMLQEPAFEEQKLQIALSQKREELRRIADNPQKLAFREFNRLLYPDDPRGRYATVASLENVSRDDLASFHRKYFFPANMMIALSGDISRDDAVKTIERYFGIRENPRSAAAVLPPPSKSAGGPYFIRKPLSQSVVVSGELSVGKKDPDYHAFAVLDFIIGSGGFPSRIFTAVRNNEGLAYSAGSFYRARGNYGVFGTYAFTKTSSTLQAFLLIRSILKDVAAGAVSQADLDWAKKSVLNGFIFSFEEPAQIAAQQMTVEFEDLPRDYLSAYRRRIETVTLNDLKRVAAKYLDEKKRLTVILGDVEQFGKWPDAWEGPVFLNPQP
ncbi:MAG: insulinase family protein [Deltaproteobacteria bacterium]|nr:insulinase family protein [Syntrophaceae bacterium]NLX51437.1 insulinase family protein [Deltaproteobacteria bacterium]